MIKIICEQEADFYEKIAQKAFKQLELKGKGLIELILTDDEEIHALNKQFREKDSATDVLSFPSIDFREGIKSLNKSNYPFEYDHEQKAVLLGSVVINTHMAKLQAKEYGHSYERELGYLFLHGLLHVMGYDHMQEEDKRLMREMEERILNQLDLAVKTAEND